MSQKCYQVPSTHTEISEKYKNSLKRNTHRCCFRDCLQISLLLSSKCNPSSKFGDDPLSNGQTLVQRKLLKTLDRG